MLELQVIKHVIEEKTNLRDKKFVIMECFLTYLNKTAEEKYLWRSN